SFIIAVIAPAVQTLNSESGFDGASGGSLLAQASGQRRLRPLADPARPRAGGPHLPPLPPAPADDADPGAGTARDPVRPALRRLERDPVRPQAVAGPRGGLGAAAHPGLPLAPAAAGPGHGPHSDEDRAHPGGAARLSRTRPRSANGRDPGGQECFP